MKKKSAKLNSALSDVVNLHSGERVTDIARTGTLCTFLDEQCPGGTMEIVIVGRCCLSEHQGVMGSGWSYQNLEAWS